MLFPRLRVILLGILAAEMVLAFFGVKYYIRFSGNAKLITDFPNVSVNRNFILEEPGFSQNFTTTQFIFTSVDVVSTGMFADIELKDRTTGEVFGKATALRVVARDDDGDPAELLFIIQAAYIGAQRNAVPWISGSESFLTSDQLSGIFPRGKRLKLIPLLDLERPELKELAEYLYYAQRYYGNDLSNVRSFMDSGLTKGRAEIMFALDLVWSGLR